MTINEFITEFSKATGKRKWANGKCGYDALGLYLRWTSDSASNEQCCPITYVLLDKTGEFVSCDNLESTLVAAKKIGLSEEDAIKIIYAADDRGVCDQKLRQRLVNLASR